LKVFVIIPYILRLPVANDWKAFFNIQKSTYPLAYAIFYFN